MPGFHCNTNSYLLQSGVSHLLYRLHFHLSSRHEGKTDRVLSLCSDSCCISTQAGRSLAGLCTSATIRSKGSRFVTKSWTQGTQEQGESYRVMLLGQGLRLGLLIDFRVSSEGLGPGQIKVCRTVLGCWESEYWTQGQQLPGRRTCNVRMQFHLQVVLRQGAPGVWPHVCQARINVLDRNFLFVDGLLRVMKVGWAVKERTLLVFGSLLGSGTQLRVVLAGRL